MVGASTTCCGSLFQSVTIRWLKKFFRMSRLYAIRSAVSWSVVVSSHASSLIRVVTLSLTVCILLMYPLVLSFIFLRHSFDSHLPFLFLVSCFLFLVSSFLFLWNELSYAVVNNFFKKRAMTHLQFYSQSSSSS